MIIAHPCYLSISLQNGEAIEGDVRDPPHAGRILVKRIEHSVTKPMDLKRVRPVGHEVHSPLIVTKYMDQASPKLAAALASCGTLDVCKFQYFLTGPKAGNVPIFVITLGNAVISSIETWAPESQPMQFTRSGCLERVLLCYESISWAHWRDGTMTERTWMLDV